MSKRPAPTPSEAEARRLTERLQAAAGREHLEVKQHGQHLIVVAREQGEAVPLARLSSLGAGQFGLSIMWHTGRWQRVPVMGSLDEVAQGLLDDWADLLEPVA